MLATRYSSFWEGSREDFQITQRIGSLRSFRWNQAYRLLLYQSDAGRSATPGDWEKGIHAAGIGDRAHNYGTHGGNSLFLVSTCNE